MDEHVLVNRYRVSVFVNMVGTGLDTGHMKFQLLEHKLNRTVLIPGIPTFFSFFNQEIFHFRKLFLYL